MIAAPPTNTRANVPMNSAMKWRQESRIGDAPSKNGVSRTGFTASIHATKHKCSVDTAKTERVGENVLYPLGPSSSRQKVKIAGLVGNIEVHSGRQPFPVDGEC